MDNLQIAQEINTRIGNSPVPFDSVYSIALAIYQELGGEGNDFDSVYSILLEILPLASETAHVIDDSSISLTKTWSSSKIASELADAGFNVEIVTELPSVGNPHTIYFILKQDSSVGDVYDEWMYIDGNWEMVGNTQIDLSDYATIANVDASLALKADKTYVDASLALKQNTLTAGDNILIENDTILALTASNSEIDLLFKTPVPLNEIWYTSLDGNIINVERTAFTSEIVSNTYNNGKGIVKFADNVYTVGALAYKNKTNLTSIELPEVTGRIGGDCFTGCINLTSIVIPATVTSIIRNAFSGCTHLTSISFTGTISQWNSISKGSGWKTKVPATVVHCSDGDVNI